MSVDIHNGVRLLRGSRNLESRFWEQATGRISRVKTQSSLLPANEHIDVLSTPYPLGNTMKFQWTCRAYDYEYSVWVSRRIFDSIPIPEFDFLEIPAFNYRIIHVPMKRDARLKSHNFQVKSFTTAEASEWYFKESSETFEVNVLYIWKTILWVEKRILRMFDKNMHRTVGYFNIDCACRCNKFEQRLSEAVLID